MRKFLFLLLAFSLLTVLPAAAQTAGEDTAQEATSRLAYIGWIEELFKEHNVALWDMFLAPDFVYHADSGDMTRAALLESYKQNDIGLIPDLTQRWYETIAEGDMVVAPFVMQGTCPDDPAFPNRACDWSAVDILRVKDGQIAEYWNVMDALYAYRQWGFVPMAGPQPAVTEALVPVRQENMHSRAENKALVQQAVAQFMGGSAAADVFAPNLVAHLPLSLYPDTLDLQGYQDAAAVYQQAFPGFTLTPREDIAPGGLIADANLVAFVYTFSGKFTGELRGLAPLATDVSYPGINVYRLVDGKIAEVWSAWDTYSELTQMQPPTTEAAS